MNNEQEIFSVTPEAIHITQLQARAFGNFLLSRNAWETLAASQPALMDYANSVASDESIDDQAYGAGILNTYINIHNQMELDGEMPSITLDDIGLLSANIADQHLFDGVSEDPEASPEDVIDLYADESFNDFLDKLAASSPEFAELIGYTVESFSTVEEKNSFLRGVYDVFMPFYNKREAEYLHDHLVWLPGLMSAIESSYYTSDIDDYYAKQS